MNTKTATAVLSFAIRNGGHVFAGNDAENGRVVRTSASTLRALARRGLLTLSLSPDGGVMGTITQAGRHYVEAGT